jgi:hypothetical protein
VLSGFPPPGEKPVTAAESASAAVAAERAAASADWEEHLLFSDVVSQRAGAGGLPPEYRAIETLFFEG